MSNQPAGQGEDRGGESLPGSASSATGAETVRSDAAVVSVPLLEERAVIQRREMVTGRVRVTTRSEPVEEVAHAVLHGDLVEVTHVAIDQVVVGPVPQVRVEGDLTVVPVLEEVLVVEKRLVLKEEIHIRKRQTAEAAAVPVTLQKQRAVVERLEGSDDNVPAERAAGV